MYIIGDAGVEERQHAGECASCQSRIANFAASLSNFHEAVQIWSDRKATKRRAEEMRWTVIPATDHLDRMLPLVALDVPSAEQALKLAEQVAPAVGARLAA